MAFRDDIGNITEKEVFSKYFKWTVANFLSFLRTNNNIQITSPTFYFKCHHCVLGLEISDDEEWIGILSLISPKNILIQVKLGILNADGEEYKSFSVHYKNDDPDIDSYEQQHFLQKSELNKVLRSGELTVFCEIILEESEREVMQMDAFDGILAA